MAGPGRDAAGRTRVAILGGGPAALAAAFELTSTPELQARHDIWPAAATNPDCTGFDWRRLVAAPELQGPARLEDQYLRVNHPATERYVLTLAGTVKTRRWPSERCFENLVFAGDWTRNGFDAGCVEGAVTSGMLAAHEICPPLRRRPIAGVHGPIGFPNGPRRIGDGWPCGTLAEGVDAAGRLAIWSGERLRALAGRPR